MKGALVGRENILGKESKSDTDLLLAPSRWIALLLILLLYCLPIPATTRPVAGTLGAGSVANFTAADGAPFQRNVPLTLLQNVCQRSYGSLCGTPSQRDTIVQKIAKLNYWRQPNSSETMFLLPTQAELQKAQGFPASDLDYVVVRCR